MKKLIVNIQKKMREEYKYYTKKTQLKCKKKGKKSKKQRGNTKTDRKY